MEEGSVRCERDGAVATLVFDRPHARNAMTWKMYAQLADACVALAADATVRAVVLRGAGGEAFVAGTDIAQFRAFEGADDGVAYERRMEACIAALEALPAPTLAVVEGWAVGGGLVIAAACDLRIGTPKARFAVPIARTLGNCLSVANHARLAAALGTARTKRMLMLASELDAAEALAAGFVAEIVAPEDLDARVAAYCERLLAHAPLTLRVTKEAVRRVALAGLPDGEDLERSCYGSADFREGVAAFVEKRRPRWTGR